MSNCNELDQQSQRQINVKACIVKRVILTSYPCFGRRQHLSTDFVRTLISDCKGRVAVRFGHGLVSRFLPLSKSVNDDRREVQAAKLKIHLVETASASEARFFACYRAASGTIHISAHRGVRSA